MDKVTFFTDELDGTEYATIDRGNSEFTTMLKSVYEAQQAQAALSTPIVTPPAVEETPVVEESAPEEEAPPVVEETI